MKTTQTEETWVCFSVRLDTTLDCNYATTKHLNRWMNHGYDK